MKRIKELVPGLVRRLCEITSELPQYSINRPEAIGWARKLGMTPGQILDEGQQYHFWTSEQAKQFSIGVRSTNWENTQTSDLNVASSNLAASTTHE